MNEKLLNILELELLMHWLDAQELIKKKHKKMEEQKKQEASNNE